MKKNLSIFILFFLLSGIGFSIYQELTKKPISFKAQRLSCQQYTTTFEKILNKEAIKKAQNLLQTHNYTFSSSIWKSEYATSKIFDFVSQEDIDKLTQQTISKYQVDNKPNQQKLHINFYTRENDTKDPNKKSDSCKLYAGYLVYEFKLDNKLIYKIQTDFMSFKGEDIPSRIECIFNSFLSIK